MKKLLMILGFYGLAVAPVAAAERWPAKPCNDLREVRAIFDGIEADAADKAASRTAILLLQGRFCGVSVKADMAADRAVIAAADRRAPTPRRALNCVTLGLGKGDAVTNCD